ncbi:MAG: MBG domain-containing protein [Blastocatellia bacterium]
MRTTTLRDARRHVLLVSLVLCLSLGFALARSGAASSFNKSLRQKMSALFRQPASPRMADRQAATSAKNAVSAAGLKTSAALGFAPVAGLGKGLHFPGNSLSYAFANASPDFSAYTRVTFEAWINPSVISGRQEIMTKAPFAFYLQDGKPAVNLQGITNSPKVAASAVATNVWTHVAMSWDSLDVRLYVNGVQQLTAQASGSLGASGTMLGIGANLDSTEPTFFTGLIDEIRIWNVSRTEGQIASNMRNGLRGDEAGLELYYRMDETSGSTLSNAVSGQYTGEFTGSVTRTTDAGADDFTVAEDTTYTSRLFFYDRDSNDVAVLLPVTAGKGTVTITDAATGAFTYTPNANVTGADSFTFQVYDSVSAPASSATSNTATVRITITPVNDLPTITAGAAQGAAQGITLTGVQVATVSDVETAAGSLTLSATTTNNVSLTNISNNNGTLTANVVIACNAVAGATQIPLTVTDGNGATAAANLTVNVSPASLNITQQPVSQSVCEGGATSFSVTATGTGTAIYQWRKGGNPINGATAATYSITGAATSDADNYDCVVTNECGTVTSSAVTLWVYRSPAVTQHPSNASTTVGSAATFTASANANPGSSTFVRPAGLEAAGNETPALSVVWQLSTDNGDNWSNVPGATTASLTVSNATIGMNGNRYRAVFTTTCGTATTNAATLTVNAATTTTAIATPTGASVYGQSVSFTASVTSNNTTVTSGTVSFRDGATVIGDPVTLDNNGQATLTTSALTAGAHSVTAEYSANSSYLPSTSATGASLTVSPAPLTVTANSTSRAYGAANPVFTGILGALRNNDNITATFATVATTASNVGTYAITPTLADPGGRLGNYDVTITNGTLSVNKARLTIVTSDATRGYGGENPVFTGTISGLLNNDNITASYGTTAVAASAAGTYAITATLADPGARLDNYDVTITNGMLTVSRTGLIIAANDATRVYGGENPVFTGTISGLLNNDNITASYGTPAVAGSAAGTYAITATLADPGGRLGNYDVTSVNGTLTVSRAGLTIVANDATRVYGGENPVFTGTISGLLNNDNLPASYSTPAVAGSAAGTYAITPTLADPGGRLGNYDVTITNGTLSVNKARLTIAANDATRGYGGENPVFTGTISGLLNNENITASYGTPAVAGSAAGTYAITPTLADPGGRLGNYDVTITNGTLTVNKARLTITAAAATRVYGAANPVLAGSIVGLLNNDNITASYSTTAVTASAAGQYPIVPAAVDPTDRLANYDLSVTNGALTVSRAPLTVTANNTTRVYGAANPSFTGSINGLVNEDNITAAYGTTAVAASGIGTYAITATLADPGNRAGNYEITYVNGTLTVTRAALTITANSATRAYGAVNPALTGTITGALSGDNITATWTTTALTSSAAGKYPITGLVDANEKNANYDIGYVNGELTIGRAPLTVAVNNASRPYGTSNPAFTGVITGLVNGDNLTASYSTTAVTTSATGGYPITATLNDPGNKAANYEVTITPGTLSVSRVGLTVTAENKTRTYGAANPALTYTITGFAPGESSSVVTGAPALTTTATTASAAGGYQIVPAQGTLASANYSFTFVNGTLTVANATPAVTLGSASATSTWGQSQTFTASLTRGGADVPFPAGTVTFRDGANTLGTGTIDNAGQASFTTSALAVGDHSVVAEYAGNSNYNAAASANFALAVSKAETTTTVAASLATISAGIPVTFSASVTGGVTGLTGTVEFFDGATSLGTATVGNGAASLNVTSLTEGTHSIRAVYSGDANFNGSASATLSQNVLAACSYAVSRSEVVVGAAAGAYTLNVTTRGDCQWTASSSVPWISVPANLSSSGNGPVTINVEALGVGAPVREGRITIAGQQITITQSRTLALVSSASYAGNAVSADSIVAGFSLGLTNLSESATTTPLPQTLAGLQVKFRDVAGAEYFAALIYASGTQVNFVVPRNLRTGTAIVRVYNGEIEVAASSIEIVNVTPSIYSANASGVGPAAALLLRARSNGTQLYEATFSYDNGTSQFVNRTIDLSGPGGGLTEEVYLILFGTGFRNLSNAGSVRVTLGTIDGEVVYAGAQPDFVGLDQINVKLPASLAGAGVVTVTVTIDGVTANTTQLRFTGTN